MTFGLQFIKIYMQSSSLLLETLSLKKTPLFKPHQVLLCWLTWVFIKGELI